MKVIAVVNQKGGAAKTTTSMNLGAVVARAGKRVLLLDLDCQGSLTSVLGSRFEHQGNLFEGYLEPVKTRVPGMDLVPSSGMVLDDLAKEYDQKGKPKYGLLRLILPNYTGYEVVIVDCPPDVRGMTLNGMAAADLVLIPCRMTSDILQVDATLTVLEKVKRSGVPVTSQLAGVATQFQRGAAERKMLEATRARYDFWNETVIRMSAIYSRVGVDGKFLPAAMIGRGKSHAPLVDHTSLAQELGLIDR